MLRAVGFAQQELAAWSRQKPCAALPTCRPVFSRRQQHPKGTGDVSDTQPTHLYGTRPLVGPVCSVTTTSNSSLQLTYVHLTARASRCQASSSNYGLAATGALSAHSGADRALHLGRWCALQPSSGAAPLACCQPPSAATTLLWRSVTSAMNAYLQRSGWADGHAQGASHSLAADWAPWRRCVTRRCLPNLAHACRGREDGGRAGHPRL